MTTKTAPKTLMSRSPATGTDLKAWAAHGRKHIEAAVDEAYGAFLTWRTSRAVVRAGLLTEIAAELTARREELARLATDEMGKPIGEALAEIDKCAWTCRFYSEQAQSFLANREVKTMAMRSWVRYEPLGPVLAVMPWNYPFWQVIRFAAPALAAGNTVLLKHAPNVSGCALAVEDVIRTAARSVGAPEAVFTTLLIAEEDVPQTVGRLISDPLIAAVTVTGSEKAGIAVATEAARAVKKTVLELGGSDPFVVLDDADLQGAVKLALRSRFLNAGQSCLAAKRFIVADTVADEFCDMLARAVAAMKVGDPHDPDVQIGPLARPDLVDTLARQVEASVQAGAVLLTGGQRPQGKGYFYLPTVLAQVTPDMPVFREETFGPVAAVIRAADDAEAARLADDTSFGLGASVWSADPTRALEVGSQITSGALFINALVASDPRLPFGGTRRSGYGRELSAEGIREFTNVRTIWVDS